MSADQVFDARKGKRIRWLGYVLDGELATLFKGYSSAWASDKDKGIAYCQNSQK
jgi:hypothetical protein